MKPSVNIQAPPFAVAKVLLSAIAVAVLLIPYALLAASIAGDSNSIEQVMCNLVLILSGRTGKAIATVGVITIGVYKLLGKITWGMLFIVCIGIALIFGASSIITTLGGNASGCTAGTVIDT